MDRHHLQELLEVVDKYDSSIVDIIGDWYKRLDEQAILGRWDWFFGLALTLLKPLPSSTPQINYGHRKGLLLSFGIVPREVRVLRRVLTPHHQLRNSSGLQ